MPLPQHISGPEEGPVNVLAELLRGIDGTSRGLPNPPPEIVQPSVVAPVASIGVAPVAKSQAEPVSAEQPKSETLVMPPRMKSLLPDVWAIAIA